MRLVIDLQGAQGSSRLRGIGRYSRELVLGMAREARDHEVIVALNATMEDGLDELCDVLRDVLPGSAIRHWWGPTGAAEVVAARPTRQTGGEWLRARALAAMRPDALLVTSVFEGAGDDVISRWPSALSRLPTVAVCYDLIPLVQRADYLDGLWAGGLKDWYLRRLQELSMADGLLAISEASRDDAIRQIGYPAERITNVSAGIGPSFRPIALDAGQRAALFARYGLRDGFVLFVGGGDQRKNEAGLIRAHGLLPPELRRRHPLAIVGKVDPLTLNAAAREAGLAPEDLILIRFVEEADLPALYASCALFVLPSHYEGFGLPAAEAMACGAPTLGSSTASMPEVIGLPEATFDPADPADMARCIARGLSDEVFRQRLLAHAPTQAARFTWSRTAALAWEAIEGFCPVRDPPAPRRLSRLAVTSPLPPLASGIADYTRDLVPALARHYDVTLVAPGGSTDDEWLRVNFPVLDPGEFRSQASRFDRLLHQIGNSHFHAFQLDSLLPDFGGVVTLHDSFLSGAERWRAAVLRDPQALTRVLHDAHGWPAVVLLTAAGEDAAVGAHPASLSVLRDADRVIQHSAHARRLLREHFGDAATRDVAIVPPPRNALPPADKRGARMRLGDPGDGLIVASFGAVASTKLPGLMLAAWRRVAPELPGARLVLVGEVSRDSEELVAAAAGDHRSSLLVTGRVDRGGYLDWLRAADVAVQLRTQSRGESSGALLDCLSAGLPTIVNAHGAMAEVPAGTVLALPDPFTEDELVAALLRLGRDAREREALGRRGIAHLREALSPHRTAQLYADVIEATYATCDTATRSMQDADLPAGDADDLATLSQAAVATFPSRRPPLLMLDVTPVNGVVGLPAGMLRHLLSQHAPNLRVEPVEADGNRNWHTVPSLAETLLGLQVTGVRPRQVAAAPGDVMLLAMLPEELSPLEPGLERLRRRGVLLVAWPHGATPTVQDAGPASGKADEFIALVPDPNGSTPPEWLHALCRNGWRWEA